VQTSENAKKWKFNIGGERDKKKVHENAVIITRDSNG